MNWAMHRVHWAPRRLGGTNLTKIQKISEHLTADGTILGAYWTLKLGSDVILEINAQ
jgi:hypothetical protein